MWMKQIWGFVNIMPCAGLKPVTIHPSLTGRNIHWYHFIIDATWQLQNYDNDFQWAAKPFHSESKLRHDKTNKMAVHPAKIQISLGIRPVWSEPSLCA